MPDIRRSLRRGWRRVIFLTLRQLLRVTGFASARRLGRLCGDIEFALAWRQRQRCVHDLAQLLGRPDGDPWVRGQLRQAHRVNAIAMLETLAMFDRRQDERMLDKQCDVLGSEHLQAALAMGHGAILLAAHMGNCALLATHLAFSGWAVSVVYRPQTSYAPGVIESGLPLYGIDGISATAGIHAYARMLAALRRGRILFVTMDQGIKAAQDGIMMRFLGKNMPFSAGPAQLARHSGAPLLVVRTTAAEPVWRFSIETPPARAAEASLESDVEFLARLTEQQILQYPHLWSWHQRRWRKHPMVGQ